MREFLPEVKNFKISQQALRTFLILIIFGLLLLKFGYQNQQQKILEKKKLLFELRQALLQKKLQFSKNNATLGDPKSASLYFFNNTERQILSQLYSKNEDALLLQIKLSKSLNELAERKGLRTQGLEILNLKQEKNVTEIPILIKTKGPIKNTLEYLREVEIFLQKRKKFYKLKELSLHISGATEKELELILRISFFKSEI